MSNMQSIGYPKLLMLIRHGESIRNKAKEGVVYFRDEDSRLGAEKFGDSKTPLNANGVMQAKKTGEYLRQQFDRPDYIYHSGYERTLQTTDEILQAYPKRERDKIKIRRNLLIRERDVGYTYNMTVQQVANHFPWLAEYWDTTGSFFARPPGGESSADVVSRVDYFLRTLFAKRADQQVWIVLHGGSIKAMRFLLEDWTYDQANNWAGGQAPKNCGVTIYEYDENKKRLVLKKYNEVFWRP